MQLVEQARSPCFTSSRPGRARQQ